MDGASPAGPQLGVDPRKDLVPARFFLGFLCQLLTCPAAIPQGTGCYRTTGVGLHRASALLEFCRGCSYETRSRCHCSITSSARFLCLTASLASCRPRISAVIYSRTSSPKTGDYCWNTLIASTMRSKRGPPVAAMPTSMECSGFTEAKRTMPGSGTNTMRSSCMGSSCPSSVIRAKRKADLSDFAISQADDQTGPDRRTLCACV